MGEGSGNTMGWSVELCGGTHVRRTGDIGIISVLGDSGVAAGVRRIEALTGTVARKAAEKQVQLAKAAAAELKTPLEDMSARVVALLDERKKLERELSDARKKLAMGGGVQPTAAQMAADSSNRAMEGLGPMRGLRDFKDFKLFTKTVAGIDLKDLRSLADEGKKQVGSGVVVIVARTDDGKAGIVVGVTADLTARFNAVDLVRKGAEALGGKGGGGRPDMAQAGGPDGSKAEQALQAVEAALSAP
jgi:alanyl-tRNA synthetase